ncbi:MAG: hypothetical protein HYW38_01025 [Candidatus Colwellbacteria bacterium]|nr:hypothetical protein [Candidatus Colwellbacteria bacterium]
MTVEDALGLVPRATYTLEEIMGEVVIQLRFNGKLVASAQFVPVGPRGEEEVAVQITAVSPPKDWVPE